MDGVIAWVTFAGAWLLVAGPLYQGSVELNELDVDREGIQGKTQAAQTTQNRPSAWWWLLPPVMYVLHRRWYRALRREILSQLTQTQREQLTSFQSKATGWFTVAGGATLLAAGETWQIVKHYDWPVWAFSLLMVVMLAAAVLSTAVFMIGAAQIRRADGTALPAGEDDDRDPADGLRLVVVRHRVGSGEALIQGPALRLVGDDGDGREGLAAHLDGRVRVGQQVVIPGRMAVGAGVAGRHDVAVAIGQVGEGHGPALAGSRAGRGQQQELHAGVVAADLPVLGPELGHDPVLATTGRRYLMDLMASHDVDAIACRPGAARFPGEGF
jgi:hypothetical protein